MVAVHCVLTLADDASLESLTTPFALVQVLSYWSKIQASTVTTFCSNECYYRESAFSRVLCLALLGGEISTPHLDWLFFHAADDGEPKKLHPLYPLAPIDVMAMQKALI